VIFLPIKNEKNGNFLGIISFILTIYCLHSFKYESSFWYKYWEEQITKTQIIQLWAMYIYLLNELKLYLKPDNKWPGPLPANYSSMFTLESIVSLPAIRCRYGLEVWRMDLWWSKTDNEHFFKNSKCKPIMYKVDLIENRYN